MGKKTQSVTELSETTAVSNAGELYDYLEQNGDYMDIDVPPEKGYDKEAYIAQKKQEREDTYALANSTAEKVCADPQALREYLNVQSRFLDKSANNGLLIYAQRPDAKLYYSSQDWKKRGRHPSNGQKSFVVLQRGEQFINDAGATQRSIRAVHVFDYTQTTGAMLKERTGRYIPKPEELFKAMINSKPVPVGLCDPGQLNGLSSLYVSDEARIYLAKGLDAETMLKSLAEEFAHAYLDKHDGLYSRETSMVPAECAAYLFCRRYNLDVSGFNLSGVKEAYAGLDARELCTELEAIRGIAQASAKGVEALFPTQEQTRNFGNAR